MHCCLRNGDCSCCAHSPDSFVPPLQASASGNSTAKRVFRREVQLQQLVLVGAKLLTNSSSYHATARKAVLQSIASSVAPTTATGRRLLADATVQSLGELGR